MRLLGAAVAGVLLTAACAGADDEAGDAREPATSAGTPSTSAPSTGTPSADVPFEQLTGAEIARAGSEAMGALTSLRYRLSVRGGPNPTTADVRAAGDGSCTGSITVGGGRIEILGVADEQW